MLAVLHVREARRMCATLPQLRRDVVQTCVGQSPRFYLGTLTLPTMKGERGKKRERGKEEGKEEGRERGAEVCPGMNKRNGDGKAWAIFSSGNVYHDYISRLIRSLCGPTIASPAPPTMSFSLSPLWKIKRRSSLLLKVSDINVIFNTICNNIVIK